jgi:prepilin-type N-terminal cleavage/methylation domain-containing protein/prepilin-type processing-associated H-X9-DG protein
MKKSFTLIELLVVIAIIGILAGLSAPALSAARESARNTACMNQLSQIGKATVMYHKNNAGYIPGTGSETAGSLSFDKTTDPAYRLLKGGYLTGQRETVSAALMDKYFHCPSDINEKFKESNNSYLWFYKDDRCVIGKNNPNAAIWSDLVRTSDEKSGNHPAVTNILYLGGHVRSKELNIDNFNNVNQLDE